MPPARQLRASDQAQLVGMDSIFGACVRLLMGLAQLTGLSYGQVNVVYVILFPLAWPA